MKLSFKIKLVTGKEQKELLREIMSAYNSACNHVSKYAYDNKIFNNFSLHHALYKIIREEYKLPSQFAVSIFSKVADSYKTELTKAVKEKRDISLCKFKKNSAVVYDNKILTYGKENVVSIKTLNKRLKLPSCIYAPDKIPYFKGEADLVSNNGEFYVVQTIDVPKASPKAIKGYLGIDLGIVQIATDSDGNSYSGEVIEKKRIKYSSHQQRLQKRNTASSKRRVRKINNRESRFRKDINHQISKHIVTKAESTSQGIALEKLVQFFDKTRVRHNKRSSRCSWSFFQLRSFIQYKANILGVPVILVDPAYTSQTCFECKHIDKNNRKSQSKFCCVSCGHTNNADFNAAKNIKFKASVNMPIVSE